MLFALPNLLTYARIAAVPAATVALGEGRHLTASMIFLAACITAGLDGYAARKLNLRSALGTMLDPIADKLLVAAVLMMLAADHTVDGVHLIAAVVILCREITVSGLREYLAATRVSLPVTGSAKLKTAAQMTALVLLVYGAPFIEVGLWLLWSAAALTVYTGYGYLRAGITQALSHDAD